MIEHDEPHDQPNHDLEAPRDRARDDDWVADVRRWYAERARGVDVAGRQEVLKGLLQEWS